MCFPPDLGSFSSSSAEWVSIRMTKHTQYLANGDPGVDS